MTERSLAYARYRQPEADPETLRAACLDRLPDPVVAQGCLYLGPRGCTLDRELRSDICNHFERGSRFRLGQLHAQAGRGPLVAVAVVADQHEHPEAGARGLRIVSWTDAGFQVHDDVALGALEAPPAAALSSQERS